MASMDRSGNTCREMGKYSSYPSICIYIIHLSIHFYICPSIYLIQPSIPISLSKFLVPTYLSIYLSIYLLMYPSIYPFMVLFIHLSIYLFIYLSINSYVNLSIRISFIYLSIHLSIYNGMPLPIGHSNQTERQRKNNCSCRYLV